MWNSKIYYSLLKNFSKELRKETQSLEEKGKHFESSVTNYRNDLHCIEYKERF